MRKNREEHRIDRYYVSCGDGIYMHRTPIKLAINPLLRRIQFWTDYPFVIASRTVFVDELPHFCGYELTRVKWREK